MSNAPRPVNSFAIARTGEVVCLTQTKTLLRDSPCRHRWELSSSQEKEWVISQLEQSLPGDGEAHVFLRQRAALMADEMLENALFAAPRDSHGKPIYRKGEKRVLLPGECITFCSLYDGHTLALEVTDTWGRLTSETVRAFLDMNLAGEDTKEHRSGRGLYFMWCFLKDFYLSVVPGVETTIGGLLQLNTAR
ncbi:hypothetical protein [Geobacter sp. SVR]|uniref:hypothetical protein n=1 Tax=Geobacter sp. SVR TaxID=2495594 RepID=UPI001567571C|nr:hypothetical protein [Geobacter sp. SVR]BCS55938.1 hypothetical protein GSVR_42460 [Geobacter sp. SVR]